MSASSLVWRELHWSRPLDPDRCIQLLRSLATGAGVGSHLVLEVRARNHRVSYLLGAPKERIDGYARQIADFLPDCRIAKVVEPRGSATTARQVVASTRNRQLTVTDSEVVARSLLGALASAGRNETVTVQLLLGRGVRPSIEQSKAPSSTQPLWSLLWNGSLPQSAEASRAARDKHAEHGFACLIRIGVSARTIERRRSLVGAAFAALRTTEPGGLRLGHRSTSAAAFHQGSRPFWTWSTQLTIHEVLAFSGWPVGESQLPGIPPLHPKRLSPTAAGRPERIIAASTAPGVTALVSQSVSDALRHRHVLGPSGVGKSVLLGRLITQDIEAGQPVVVIEPKGDLVDDVLTHIPKHRRGDVVILDPVDARPVGLNPLALTSGATPEVAAEAVLAIFKDLYADSWGPRTQDILHACLLTLTRWAAVHPGEPGASLALLPMLLTNSGFRKQITREVRDPVALDSFWHWYESISDAERAAAIAPVMNKLRAWLYHPGLRAVLGQRAPRLSVRDIFAGHGSESAPILLVPLRTGLIGREAARLLGSLALAQVWQAIQARTTLAERRRRPVSIYIDECQEYVRLTTDIGDALATARGLGCSFTLAHQFLNQLPPELRAGVLANARSRICFQLGADDALTMAKGHPEITGEDFTSLEPYEVQASLVVDHRVTPYAAGRCARPGPASSSASQLRAESRKRFGVDPTVVEANLVALITQRAAPQAHAGRRARRTDSDKQQSGGAS